MVWTTICATFALLSSEQAIANGTFHPRCSYHLLATYNITLHTGQDAADTLEHLLTQSMGTQLYFKQTLVQAHGQHSAVHG